MVTGPGVITGRSGTLGEVHYVEENDWPHNTTLWVADFKRNFLKFIDYLFKHIGFQKFSSGSGVPTLNRNDAHAYKISIPKCIQTQKVIAEALSDAELLIITLEKLIAKKCLIRQGVMQELLTGKRRLPGFGGRGKAIQLEKLCDIGSGGTPDTNQDMLWDGDIPWCTPTDITALNGRKYIWDTERHISQFGLKQSSAEIIPENSIIMTSRATVGECAINKIRITTNQGFKNLVPSGQVDVEYLYYMMTMMKDKLIALYGGSNFLEINRRQLSTFEIIMPDKDEQTAIASILSNFDTYIDMMEKKLQKIRQVKQGMMQELLTGRIRLA